MPFGLALMPSVEGLPLVLTGNSLIKRKCTRKLMSKKACTQAERSRWEVQGFQMRLLDGWQLPMKVSRAPGGGAGPHLCDHQGLELQELSSFLRGKVGECGGTKLLLNANRLLCNYQFFQMKKEERADR